MPSLEIFSYAKSFAYELSAEIINIFYIPHGLVWYIIGNKEWTSLTQESSPRNRSFV